MKKIMLAVCLMFGAATLVSAQETQSQTQSPTSTQQQDQEGQEITVAELPDAVSQKLESQDYSGWTVASVHKKMDESQNEIYVVKMRQGTETKKVKFDEDGNKIDKKDKSGRSNYRDDATQPDETDQPGDIEQP